MFLPWSHIYYSFSAPTWASQLYYLPLRAERGQAVEVSGWRQSAGQEVTQQDWEQGLLTPQSQLPQLRLTDEGTEHH